MQEEQQEQKQEEISEVEQLKQQLADAQKSIEALANKKDELLKETKAAKEEKRKQAEEAEKVKLDAASKNGEFETLWKQAQDELNKERAQRDADRKKVRTQTIENEALKIAVDLAKDDKKAELLKRFLADSISNVADEYGNVDGDVLNGVRKQFETDELYSALRAGNQSVGGSAQGNTRSAGVTQEKTRTEFDAMGHSQRRDFLAKGGRLKD